MRKTTLYDMDVEPTRKYAAVGCQDRSIRYGRQEGLPSRHRELPDAASSSSSWCLSRWFYVLLGQNSIYNC